MNLYDANRQWAQRPADERFWTVGEMLEACRRHWAAATELKATFKGIRVIASKGDDARSQAGEVMLAVRGTERPAALSHWGFSQLAARCHAPAEFLRTLSPALAAECLDHGMRSYLGDGRNPVELLIHSRGDDRPPIMRGMTSLRYRRIWNEEVVDELQNLLDKGWRVPPARPAFRNQPGIRPAGLGDLLADSGGSGLSVRPGDPIAPAGLYASDHDMFAFLICERAILEDGSGEPVRRGVFFSNSEVGDRALRCTTFLYRHVCGNHIVWGASDVLRRAVAHVGDARKRFHKIFDDVARYADVSARRDESRIARARRKEIAPTREAVVDRVFRIYGRRWLTREKIESAFDAAEAHAHIDGPPTTVWSLAQGLTRISQQTDYADLRAELDGVAGRLILNLI